MRAGRYTGRGTDQSATGGQAHDGPSGANDGSRRGQTDERRGGANNGSRGSSHDRAGCTKADNRSGCSGNHGADWTWVSGAP